MKIHKWTIFMSLVVCFLSIMYCISVEWEWNFISFLPERVNFFDQISKGIFGSGFLLLCSGIITYLYEYQKVFIEIKKIYSLTILHSYNINDIGKFEESRQEVKLLFIRICAIEFSPILPCKEKNKKIIEMSNMVAHIRTFYVANEHHDNNRALELFNKQFADWYSKFDELDIYFDLKILNH